jgi:hypothetical protein
MSAAKSKTYYLKIKEWWFSFGTTLVQGLSRLELWLAFWHFRYQQWGGFMQLVKYSPSLNDSPYSCINATCHYFRTSIGLPSLVIHLSILSLFLDLIKISLNLS